jgi:hypothetical protein
MKRIVPYRLFESLSSKAIDLLVEDYEDLPRELSEESAILGTYNHLIVRVIEPKLASQSRPEWDTYKGSHHWGKKTDYIPENEIWIVSGLSPNEFRRILNHEIIEREMMRALQEEHGMDPQTSWSQAHFYVKQLGF